MPPSKVTPEERAAIVEAIKAGGSCRGVAKTHGRSPDTVRKIAKAEGLAFDRSKTEAATKAKQADNREKRATTLDGLYDRVLQLLGPEMDELTGQLTGEYVIHKIGGKDNVYTSERIDAPPAEAKRDISIAIANISRSVSTLMRTANDITAVDKPDAGHGVAEQLVEHLAALRSARSASG